MSMLALRRVRIALALTCALVAVPGTSHAAGTVLRWKFKAGEKLQFHVAQETQTEINVMGMANTIKSSQVMDVTREILAVGSDGIAEVTQSIERIQMKMDSPFGAMELDSDSEKEAEGFGAMILPGLKAVVKQVVKFKVNARGEVSDIELPEEMIENLKKAQPPGGGPSMFTEDSMREQFKQTIMAFPENGVSKGDTWETTSEVDNPQTGKQTVHTVYEIEGEEIRDGVTYVKIVGKPDVKVDPKAKAQAKLNSFSGDSTILFNAKSGQLFESVENSVTDLEVDAMGNKFNTKNTTKATTRLGPSDSAAEEGAKPDASEKKDAKKDTKKDAKKKPASN